MRIVVIFLTGGRTEIVDAPFRKHQNMVTRVFGLFVFGKNSSVIYRFLTDDLRAHLKQCFQTRGYLLDEDLDTNDQPSSDDGELRLCLDDAISQHLSVLINVHEATSSRHDPIRRMTLQSGVQIFFDQVERRSRFRSSTSSQASENLRLPRIICCAWLTDPSTQSWY